MRLGIVRLASDRLAEQENRFPPRFRRAARQGAPTDAKVVRLEAPRPLARRWRSLQPADHRLDDIAGYLVLNGEHVLDAPVEALGPKAHAADRVDQFDVDADPIGRPSRTAFEQVSYAQLARDPAGIHRPALVGEAGVPSDDEQPGMA